MNDTVFYVLGLSLVAAIYLATQPEVRRRSIAAAAIPVMLVGVFFTHTRGPIFAALAVLVFCALFWRGWRRVFVLALAVLAVAVVANLSTLESSNRAQGGLGSSLEVQDRLNIAATGLWAVGEKPLFGWGLAGVGAQRGEAAVAGGEHELIPARVDDAQPGVFVVAA